MYLVGRPTYMYVGLVGSNSPTKDQKSTSVAPYARVFRGKSIDPGPDQRRTGTSVALFISILHVVAGPDQDTDQAAPPTLRALLVCSKGSQTSTKQESTQYDDAPRDGHEY